MVNANRLAVEFAAMLPADQTPETTEGYEGFFHLIGMHTNTELASLSYIIRDHDRQRFEARKRLVAECVDKINEKYGDGTATVEIKDQYYNMKEKIEPEMHVIDIVLRAMQESGVTPKVQALMAPDSASVDFLVRISSPAASTSMVHTSLSAYSLCRKLWMSSSISVA